MMLNQSKLEIDIPKFMEIAYIVSIYKGKGEKIDLQNDRGIFINIIIFLSNEVSIWW